MRETDLIKLPLKFDANNVIGLDKQYELNHKSSDSLLFDGDLFYTFGCLSDTSNFYAFLSISIGDMLYPYIVTIGKNGVPIDRKLIATTNCLRNPRYVVKSCFDSVLIDNDLRIYSNSKFIGSIEGDEPNSKSYDVCDMKQLKGQIHNTGIIEIIEGEVIDCSKK